MIILKDTYFSDSFIDILKKNTSYKIRHIDILNESNNEDITETIEFLNVITRFPDISISILENIGEQTDVILDDENDPYRKKLEFAALLSVFGDMNHDVMISTENPNSLNPFLEALVDEYPFIFVMNETQILEYIESGIDKNTNPE